MAEKTSFLIYKDIFDEVQLLTIEQRGLLFTALFEYAISRNELQTNDLALKIIFSTMRKAIDRDTKNYERKCQVNRDNRNKGSTNVDDRQQSSTTATDKDMDKDMENDMENVPDNESEPDNDFSPNGGASTSTDYQSVVDLFNSICVSLPKVQKLTEKRKMKLKTLMKTYSRDDIATVFRKTESSDFLTGKVKEFKATFDWLIEVSNFVKVHEGNYDNRKAQQDADKYFDHSLDDLFH